MSGSTYICTHKVSFSHIELKLDIEIQIQLKKYVWGQIAPGAILPSQNES